MVLHGNQQSVLLQVRTAYRFPLAVERVCVHVLPSTVGNVSDQSSDVNRRLVSVGHPPL